MRVDTSRQQLVIQCVTKQRHKNVELVQEKAAVDIDIFFAAGRSNTPLFVGSAMRQIHLNYGRTEESYMLMSLEI